MINNGTINVQAGGSLVNEANGKINNTGRFSKMVNNGVLEDHGAIYDPWVNYWQGTGGPIPSVPSTR